MSATVFNAFNAGYKIIMEETYSVSDTGKSDLVVLGKKVVGSSTMFVTWECTILSYKAPDYYWGHYFEDELAALADYHRRLLSKYESKGGARG